MKLRQMVIVVFTVMALILGTGKMTFAAPTTSPAYGSITYSESLKKPFFSFADNKVSAEDKVWNSCWQAGKQTGSKYMGDCNSAIWVHNGYLSIAVDAKGPWGTGWGTSQAIAEQYAKQVCESHGGKGCDTITTQNTSLDPNKSTEGGLGFGAAILRRAFTKNGVGDWGKEATSFVAGDVIRYVARVDNQGSVKVTPTLAYETTGPRSIYSWKGSVSLDPGVWDLYLNTTVPSNAPSGQYTFRVTLTFHGQSFAKKSQFQVIQTPTQNSSNYAGYGTVGSIYSRVRAYWKVPTATCKGLRATTVAPWVGLGGLEGGKYIEQIGTESACFLHGTQIVPTYFGWYEMLPATPQRLDDKYVVKANDAMSAIVAYGGTSNGQGVFALQLVDYTQHWTYYTTQLGPADAIARSSAEWIVEAPGIGPISAGTLTKFSPPIKFTGCYVDDKFITTRGPTVEKFMMVIKHPSGPRADTSDLEDNGTAFSVTWRNY